jgi:hypothetical protein
MEKFSILLSQARVDREIERYVREREEEMRKQQGVIYLWFTQGGFTKGERTSSLLYMYIAVVHTWSFFSDQWRL